MVRKFKSCFLGFIIGALMLSVFSAIQKLLAGYPIQFRGFYVPIIFGGIIGTILCEWRCILKEKQISLLKAKLKAEESNKLKSEFLANFSHEVRTPLNAIVGFAQLLTNESASLENRKYYSEIINSRVYDFLSVIENIMLISEIETHQIELINREFKLSYITKQIKLFAKHNDLLEANKNTVVFDFPDNVNNIELYTDQKTLLQILKRLISNAFKFTENGEITFSIRINDLNAVSFHIIDNGIGIKEEDMPIIFKKFRQIDGSLTRKYGGCGLGLTIANELTKIMNGELILKSEIDKGTVISITIPIPVKYTQDDNKPKEKHNFDFTNKNVLIVEDDMSSFELLKEYLIPTKAQIFHADSGETCIKAFKENGSISLVLMDIQLPGMDGYAAIREIKKINKNVPIIAQTAHSLSYDEEKALLSGCDDFITKPISEKVLISKVAQFIR